MSNEIPSLSAPDSPPPSLTLIRYFDLLPPELLQIIIESSAIETDRHTGYSKRQSTLRSLCLTSQLFKSIAQPLLQSKLVLAGDRAHRTLELFVEKNSVDSRASVRTIELDLRVDLILQYLIALQSVVRGATALRELSCSLSDNRWLLPFLGSSKSTLKHEEVHSLSHYFSLLLQLSRPFP
jgi:hypothetical protein